MARGQDSGAHPHRQVSRGRFYPYADANSQVMASLRSSLIKQHGAEDGNRIADGAGISFEYENEEAAENAALRSSLIKAHGDEDGNRIADSHGL